MSNRRLSLWLPFLAVAFAALPIQAVAAEYAVVANYGSGSVSLIQNSGSGWTGTPDSALSVGGLPWGVATSGRYAFVGNKDGHVDLIEAKLNENNEASLTSVQTFDFNSTVEWVSTVPGDGLLENKVYVSTKSGDGGALYELSRLSGVWTQEQIGTWSFFQAAGLASIPATVGAAEKAVITQNAAPGAGSNQVQVFEDGNMLSSHGFSDGLPTMQVAPWISGTEQYALVTRQSSFQSPPEGFPSGYLTAVNLATGVHTDLLLGYRPYAVAVVGGNAYVSDQDSSRIYKYSLSMADVPGMSLVSSLFVGDMSGVRQMIDSGDGHLLVTSSAGSAIHSINLANFGAGATQVAGTYSGVVGIGLIDPLAQEPVVPEPSSIATLATGLLAAAGGALRRKGRRKEG